MSQPVWKLIANLGDVNPIEYGGYFIYVDKTGVYGPEAELLISPDSDNGKWGVYRFSLDKCTFINGILSDNKFHPELSAWFAKPTTYLSNVANCVGGDVSGLIQWFCSDNPCERAMAYRCVGDYHGFENFDSYPLTLNHKEVLKRYKGLKAKLKALKA